MNPAYALTAKLFETTAAGLTVGGVPDGYEGFLLAERLRAAGPETYDGILFIARDDARAHAVKASIEYFVPHADVVMFPAWDCLPYDRVSPAQDLMARRMAALAWLAERRGTPEGLSDVIVLTTVNAVLQKLPAPGGERMTGRRLACGQDLDIKEFVQFLTRSGYGRTGTVMEPGEFASRGDIFDIFPPGFDAPLRIDLFDIQIENIRSFDPLTQRTTGNIPSATILPVSEISLDADSIGRFRNGYRNLFGAPGDADPLYASVSAGQKHAGMEHWLPLFHENLVSLFDYCPKALIVEDHRADTVREDRMTTINDHYDSRVTAMGRDRFGAAPFNPLAPDALYFPADAWRDMLADRLRCRLSPFQIPEDAATVSLDGRPGRKLSVEAKDGDVFENLKHYWEERQRPGKRLVIAGVTGGSADRLAGMLRDHGMETVRAGDNWLQLADLPESIAAVATLEIENGFDSDALLCVSEQDLLGDRLVRRARKSRRAENVLAEAAEVSSGDLVVHSEHGIGRYQGLETIDVGGAPHDCLKIIYDGGDKLFVPVENIDLLSRYGSDAAATPLDRLGGGAWQARKAKLRKRLRDMADALIEIAATRILQTAKKIAPTDGLYDEFCAAFPFTETEDQRAAIEAVLEDLGSGRPMDRLVCGDVGFGKTEVALRSAFATVMDGGQVAIVTPTTLLTRQHFHTFQERFRNLPVKVHQLSRLVTAKSATATRNGLADGTVDIVIGTHALLSKRIRFKNLSLLIVDEEQHFGVAHKERLKQLRADVHVLTLTATPIPRTMQLAMSGVKELSMIATPPVDRLAVRTFVLPFDPVVVREAILREKSRGGQVFYVCPRIRDLADAEAFLQEHVPEVRVVTAHGQLPTNVLEDVMSAFYDQAYDVLLSTTIIESGLDIPTANTLIVHRADMFGLAQLYQLRGRIGRSKIRGYSYFTLPAKKVPTANAEKRLKVLQTLDTLGAGFSLASHDLDIRGAGNLLGEEQSGHIREVGFELYQQMLEEAVAQARQRAGDAAEVSETDWSPQINIGAAVLIPPNYVEDLDLRLGLYRRLAGLNDGLAVDGFAAELTDRFGPLPPEVTHLLEIVRIKQHCRTANVEKIDAGPKGATLTFRNNEFSNPAGLVSYIHDQKGTAKLRPDHKLVLLRRWPEVDDILKGTAAMIAGLAKLATPVSKSSAA